MAFGHQSLRVTAVQSTGTTLMARSSDGLANDPRPEPVAAGMRFFTGTGIRAPVGFGSTNFIGGDTWSCSACHVDGLSDRMIWQAGPVPTHRYTSRGFTMLEGTWPLGWQGYLADVRNYAYTVTTNIGIYRPTQTQVDTLAAYLASIQAPPPENSLTERDGAHSAEACRGAQVYARYCESCHTGALSTSRERVERSILDRQRADIPSLLGSYRLGVWYRKGGASTLSDAVGQMAEWVGATLVPDDRAALVRYVGELTGRNLAVVTTYPRPDALLAADGHVDVVMTHALVNAPDNLARVRLLDDAGAPIAAEVTRVEPRRLRIVPRAALPFGATVRVELGAGLASERDLATRAAERMTYRVVGGARGARGGTVSGDGRGAGVWSSGHASARALAGRLRPPEHAGRHGDGARGVPQRDCVPLGGRGAALGPTAGDSAGAHPCGARDGGRLFGLRGRRGRHDGRRCRGRGHRGHGRSGASRVHPRGAGL